MTQYAGPVFTYAGNPDHNEIELLFHNLDNYDMHMITEEDISKIVQDPKIPEVMGDAFLVVPTHNYIIVTSDADANLTRVLDSPSMLDLPVAIYNCGKVTYFKVSDVYNNCALPDKYVLGCTQCIDRDSYHNCPFKEFIKYTVYSNTRQPINTDTLRSTWKPLKTKIAGYKLISPTLTANKNIAAHHRDSSDHDFGYVASNSDSRESGALERSRIINFKRDSCNNCFVKQSCWSEDGYGSNGKTGYRLKMCPGRYPLSEHETAEQILQVADLTYSDKELSYLLQNSGELDSRYDRKQYWATLGYSRQSSNMIVFTLRRVTRPYDYTQVEIPHFDDAKYIIQNYNKTEFNDIPFKLTTVEKATLVELIHYENSPDRRGGWVKTRYPKLGVTFNKYNRSFITIYRYERKNTTLRWQVNVKNLSDIYRYYGMFHNTSKILDKYAHPHAHTY